MTDADYIREIRRLHAQNLLGVVQDFVVIQHLDRLDKIAMRLEEFDKLPEVSDDKH